jgi:hypothetical protein
MAKYFSNDDHQILATLIYRRFGCDVADAASAWRRLLGNNCSDREFRMLLGKDVGAQNNRMDKALPVETESVF